MFLAHLSVVALPSEGASVGRSVRRAIAVLRESGLKHEVHAMGTEIESERLEPILEAMRRIDEVLVASGAQRVTITVKIDDRRDKRAGLKDKAESATRPR